MRRRGLLATAAIAALALLLLAALAIGSGDDRPSRARAGGGSPLVLTVAPDRPSYRFRRGAIGLSIETSQLSRGVLTPEAHALVNLLRGLGPATLRIGGNSADRSWWTQEGEPKPAWATNTVTPADLARLGQFLQAIDWRVILTVDLGHYEPARAAAEVKTATAILGSRLQAIEVGNEPNAYGTSVERLRPPSYGVDDYLAELSVYRGQILAQTPGARFAGPDLSFATSSHTWLPRIAEVNPSPFAEITHHYYPTAYNLPDGRCGRTPSPAARDLLLASTREYENVLLGRLVAAGALAHRPTRISETNTTSSCNAAGGPATSPVFASALWALDWALRAASSGVSGLNFHGKFGRCSTFSSSPVCAPRDRGSPHPMARPEYYGLLAASTLEGGRFVPVTSRGSGSFTSNVTAYATTHHDGTMTVAIDDLSPHGTSSATVLAPGYATATGMPLSAPSIHARHGVTFGGASIGADGAWRPRASRLRGGDGRFRVRLHAGSAVVLTLAPRPRR